MSSAIVWLAAFAAVAVSMHARAQAQIYKCVAADGKVAISNLACPSTSSVTKLDARPNTLDNSGFRRGAAREIDRLAGARPDAVQTETYGVNPKSSARGAPGVGSSYASECPSDRDIKNMETSLSSINGDNQREFKQDEIRRARQCQKGQGNYSKEDWKAAKEAFDDQNSISSRDRQDARIRAEGIHSAADPEEGRRIHERNENAKLAATNRPAAQPLDLLITRCDTGGCWVTDGTRFNGKGNTLVGPRGACFRTANVITCP